MIVSYQDLYVLFEHDGSYDDLYGLKRKIDPLAICHPALYFSIQFLQYHKKFYFTKLVFCVGKKCVSFEFHGTIKIEIIIKNFQILAIL